MSTISHCCFSLPGTPKAVRRARLLIGSTVQQWSACSNEVRDEVELVASELLTNAMQHAGGLMTVGLCRSGDRLFIAVLDGSPEPPQRRDAARDEPGGRGIPLIEALSVNNGWEQTQRGKKVWAEVALPSAKSDEEKNLEHDLPDEAIAALTDHFDAPSLEVEIRCIGEMTGSGSPQASAAYSPSGRWRILSAWPC